MLSKSSLPWIAGGVAVVAVGGALVSFGLPVESSSLTTLYVTEVASGGDASAPRLQVVGILGLLAIGIAILAIALGAYAVLRKRWGKQIVASVGSLWTRRTVARQNGEIDRATSVISALMEVNGEFAAALSAANTKLRGTVSAEAVGVVVVELIAEQQQLRQEMQRLSHEMDAQQEEKHAIAAKLARAEADMNTDSLSGIGNRRTFDAALTKAIADAREQKIAISLVIADIDHFKRINDAHGHQMGDEVIKMFGKLIKDSVRGTDISARYGGEEFAIIMPKAGLEAAKSLAERIRKKLEARKIIVKQSGQPLGIITASFGVAELRFGDDAASLFQRADAKLYAAKNAGRNRVFG